MVERKALLDSPAFLRQIGILMETTLTREAAHRMVLDKIGRNNLLKHVLAVEAGMRAVADRLGEDVEYWGLVGLIHDLDYHETMDDHPRHTYLTHEWLDSYGLPDEAWHAIHAHPGHIPCQTRLDWALYAVDPSTGFIVACALMHPDKKLAPIDEEFMLRRFREKRFAAGATRENMAACSNLGLELGEFLLVVRSGMMTIADELGL
ncbi:MAG: HDIG domain-containing protein [candidate division Zixibacteria bacterium]|jgi:putative nucleotidyltransferase with HDIG domain|nr:HDIG domain-containing protein [candidate division Zixibacteria bacterium]